MSNQEIANRLYELCQKGEFETAQKELFSENVTSTEKNREGKWETITGLEALKEKGKQFQSMMEEMHGGHTGEPKVYANNIFMEIGIDVTMKGMRRMNMVEMSHYVIEDGKIVSEKFYY